MTQENIQYDSDFYTLQFLESYFNMGHSTIVGKQNLYSFSENDNSIIKIIKDKNHYLCNECKAFHLINIIYEEKKEKDKIILIEEKINIKCNKKGNMSLDKFLENILYIGNLDSYKSCQSHEKEKIGFCSKCKKDLCQICKEVKDCENKQRHNFIDFKEKDKEISKKEKIIDILKKKYDDVKKAKSEISKNSESNTGTINFTETLGDLVYFCQFIEVLENAKKNFPSYIHYENIINIYHLLI